MVGINLLREGLDIPEVSLVVIFDADKQGFLRTATSLIQTIGRTARNVNGHVIMYADKISDAMEKAISETNRRRKVQKEYNKTHEITPKTIVKKIGIQIESEERERRGKEGERKRGKRGEEGRGGGKEEGLLPDGAALRYVPTVLPSSRYGR